jgi:hypothetical protein
MNRRGFGFLGNTEFEIVLGFVGRRQTLDRGFCCHSRRHDCSHDRSLTGPAGP